MPAGCEFICKNSSCDQCNNGFVITGPWPMAKIELIISAMSSKANQEDFKDKVIQLKNNGRKYVCLTLPNIEDIEISAYRVNLWSPKAKCVWQYDVELNGSSVEEAIINANLPSICPSSGCKLLDFSEATQEGVNCPSCGEKMIQSRWFSNEK